MADTHIEAVTVKGDGLTLSLLVWRRFRKPMPGLVEQILDLNQGLAALGPILPFGTVVRMPIPVEAEAAQPQARIQLW
ncbi:tail protein X [Paracoccus sp. KR1-242]|uniref:tail protein X n=1 Tax=Paracoccus sp. KR1-242 TaxID=3410028 RepID=UPI003C01BF6C